MTRSGMGMEGAGVKFEITGLDGSGVWATLPAYVAGQASPGAIGCGRSLASTYPASQHPSIPAPSIQHPPRPFFPSRCTADDSLHIASVSRRHLDCSLLRHPAGENIPFPVLLDSQPSPSCPDSRLCVLAQTRVPAPTIQSSADLD